MVEQFGNQNLNDLLKEHVIRFMADGGLTDILRGKIKTILKTEVKNTFDQTRSAMDEIILLDSNDKGAINTPNHK